MGITRKLARTPQPDGTSKYKAVVLDCEMACTVGGLNEVIIVSLVDYVKKELLMDTYVQPGHKVSNWYVYPHFLSQLLVTQYYQRFKLQYLFRKSGQPSVMASLLL